MSEITLNLLTWNSEETLVSCLESIAPVVDHIVVNDRFSTDSTIEILERYHAEIYQREFSGSFSEERNFLIGKTKTKWIFILDSDEIISREIQENLRKHVAYLEKKGFISGIYPRKNYLDGELFNVEIPGHHRLFLKEKTKYVGRVHEQLTFSGKFHNFSNCFIIHPKTWKRQREQNERYAKF